jgi:hypothetical protein
MKESKEALEIAEIDGKLCCLLSCCGSLTAALGGAWNVFGEMHLRSCRVCACREAILSCGHATNEMRGSWNFLIGICYCSIVPLLFHDGGAFFDWYLPRCSNELCRTKFQSLLVIESSVRL